MFYYYLQRRTCWYRAALSTHTKNRRWNAPSQWGVKAPMVPRGDSVASISEPIPQHRPTCWFDGLVRHREDCPDLSSDQKKPVTKENLSQEPAIELPDADGFFAELILRLVRGGNQLGSCGMEGQYPVSRGTTAGRAKRNWPAVAAETTWLNMAADPLLVELAHRQAQSFATKEVTS
jgi:hypothetical protein